MRIKKIKVKKLFGIFNHEINMKLEEQITIIHGSNGLGKTTLLRMINSLLNLNFLELSAIPFEQFEIFFGDGSTILVKKKNDEVKKNSNERLGGLVVSYIQLGKKPLNYTPVVESIEDILSIPINAVEDVVPGLSQIDRRMWRYLPTGESLELRDVILRFSEYFPEESIKFGKLPEWLINLKERNPIQFIKTQRLLSSSPISENKFRRHKNFMENAVSVYSTELAKAVEASFTDYGKIAQTLDRSFPARLVRLNSSDELSKEELLERLKELEAKRQRLISLGLLDNSTELNIQVTENEIYDRTQSVLSIYVKDMGDKLKVFDDLAEKIDLLRKIINPKFKYKEMIVNKEKGITFKTSIGEHLSPDNLSSGEQHQLVLFYELLFKIKPNSLILIDEPELSFHVAWQVEFLKDLQEITKIVSFDVLIATHSPQIINDRWDLTEELEGEN